VNSKASITAVAPEGSGTVDVTVITPEGTSPTSSADQFTYTALPFGAPAASWVPPYGGLTSGGPGVPIGRKPWKA
jgi:hypothetical protein